ncbi:MAG: PHP domain-containing protein, partial [Clostridiales bacterium]|nr:PHP domain-containing protein [Clostridiales bacterium]
GAAEGKPGAADGGKGAAGAPPEYVNNHIHTIYSFSPYSPTKAVHKAWESGLATAGIMDHDSVAGALEFIEAGRIMGVATTLGLECRCSMAGTPFEGRLLNNPDQKSVAYVAMHGIPRGSIGMAQGFITPYRERRNARNALMARRLDELFEPFGIRLGFEADVLPLSRHAEGGSVTERHILFALAGKLEAKFGRGEGLLGFLGGSLGLSAPGAVREKLLDAGNPMYGYYLLGLLKSQLVERFYIDAGDELPSVAAFVGAAREAGAIPAYAYLGDVSNSVTGDKKDQRFEDGYLDELIAWVAANGFCAVTYMPTRNTKAQLARLIGLCERHGLFQISGEDINTPFQSFVCAALGDPAYAHLVDATWALIGHEAASGEDPRDGMFSERSVARTPDLAQRVRRYAAIGRASA